MKRFDIEVQAGRAYLVGNPDGKYVRYEDAEVLVQQRDCAMDIATGAQEMADAIAAQLIDMQKQRDQLQAMSVEHILIDVVPGYDGMGLEVYAKSVDDVIAVLTELSGKVDELDIQRDQLLAALEGLVGDVQGLIEESEGVVGLHLNGDVAPWHELEAGGRYERLSCLPDALVLLANVKGGAQC